MYLLIFIVLILSNCSGLPENEVEVSSTSEYETRSLGALYNEAMDLMYSGQGLAAAKMFEEVDRQYPYSEWAVKAQLMSIFCYYINGSYDDATLSADRFISLYTAHPDIDYALYIKGLSYYSRLRDVSRDQGNSARAIEVFNILISRYGDSIYATDVKKKLVFLHNNMAGKEIFIGRYYQDLGAFLAAANRYKFVLDNYPTTPHVLEALYRLVESYLSLGLIEEAKKTAAVLGYNYPDSFWYRDAYALLQRYGLTEESLVIEKRSLKSIEDYESLYQTDIERLSN